MVRRKIPLSVVVDFSALTTSVLEVSPFFSTVSWLFRLNLRKFPTPKPFPPRFIISFYGLVFRLVFYYSDKLINPSFNGLPVFKSVTTNQPILRNQRRHHPIWVSDTKQQSLCCRIYRVYKSVRLQTMALPNHHLMLWLTNSCFNQFINLFWIVTVSSEINPSAFPDVCLLRIIGNAYNFGIHTKSFVQPDKFSA